MKLNKIKKSDFLLRVNLYQCLFIILFVVIFVIFHRSCESVNALNICAFHVAVIAVVVTFFCCIANLQYALELVHFTWK